MNKNMIFNKNNTNIVVEHNASKLSFIASNSLILGFMLVRIYLDEPIGDLLAITLTSTLAGSLYRGYYTSSRSSFIMGLVMSLIALGLILATLLSQYGVY